MKNTPIIFLENRNNFDLRDKLSPVYNRLPQV